MSIATEGLISDVTNMSRSLTIATLGWLVEITDELISPSGGKLDPSSFLNLSPADREKVTRRIRATVIIDGVRYTDTVEISDLSLSLSDVRIQMNTDDTSRPTIRIIYPR